MLETATLTEQFPETASVDPPELDQGTVYLHSISLNRQIGVVGIVSCNDTSGKNEMWVVTKHSEHNYQLDKGLLGPMADKDDLRFEYVSAARELEDGTIVTSSHTFCTEWKAHLSAQTPTPLEVQCWDVRACPTRYP